MRFSIAVAVMVVLLIASELLCSDAKPTRRRQKRVNNLNRKRRTPTITVEVGIATDPLMTKYLDEHGKDTDEKKVDYIFAHWNEVQLEWGRTEQLKYNIKIEIKHVQFLTSYPNNYQPTNKLIDTLTALCKWQSTQDINVDYFFFYTGLNHTDVHGRAFQSSACNPDKRCGIAQVTDIALSYLPVHELGHALGMYDDSEACRSTENGIMGSGIYGFTSCSARDLRKFLSNRTGSCLTKTNVKSVPDILSGRALTPDYLGQLNSADDICVLENGPGFEFRAYPERYNCGYHSCIDLNPGPKYGTMRKHVVSPRGGYCGEGKVCKQNNQCVPYKEIGVSDYEVVRGGWSEWSEMKSECSRTCGTGVRYAKRTCTNPRPKNSPRCEGSAFAGEICNTQPCPGDSDDESELIEQRATEVCEHLVGIGYIDGKVFSGKGHRYSKNGLGSCEVKCDPVKRHAAARFFRYAIMPDGTPCDGSEVKATGEMVQPATYHCVEGWCTRFGCNGKIGSKLDDCFVCEGDSSTCVVHEEVFTAGQSEPWDFTYFTTIPAGAFNIRINADQSKQRDVYFDIITSNNWDVIIDGFDAGYKAYEEKPLVDLDGTNWFYFPKIQHLHARGPLQEDVDFSVIQLTTAVPNAETKVRYSLPV